MRVVYKMEFLENYLPLIMALALGLLLFSGYPVALVLSGVGIGFAAIGISLDLMSSIELLNITTRIYGMVGENLIYPAVPMLIFMGILLERSQLASELLECLHVLLRRAPANLAIATSIIGLILAPAAGLVGASVATIGLFALPTMLRHGYRPSFAAGAVASAGTLGIIFPPAIMLFFLADLLGIRISVMFTAPVMPVVLILGLMIAYFVLRAVVTPSIAPRAKASPHLSYGQLTTYVLRSFALPTLLIVMILGSIIAGIATPTQSGAVGAVGAVLLTILNGSISLSMLAGALRQTVKVTGMVFFVVIGASVFSYTFRSLGGDSLILELMQTAGLNSWGMLTLVLAVIFALGFIIDWIEIALITLPIFFPILAGLDFGDTFETREQMMVWIAVLIAINLQTSFLTPPFGFALFFLKGVAPPEISLSDIYKGVAPVVLLQMVALQTVMLFPVIALWLPSQILE